MSDWTEYGPADLEQAREEGRAQAFKEAAEWHARKAADWGVAAMLKRKASDDEMANIYLHHMQEHERSVAHFREAAAKGQSQ